MTNERAIELLHRLQDEQFDGIHGDERREALSMAVRALEQNLVQESDSLVKDLVKDCISRKMAIDTLDKHIDTFDAIDTNYLRGLRTAMSFLKKLPSAQPTTTWLGNYCPYKCKHCGKHTDSKTPFCAWCGRRASNYEV